MLRKTLFVKPRLQVKYFLLTVFLVVFTILATYVTMWGSLLRSPALSRLSPEQWTAIEAAARTSLVWLSVVLVIVIGMESIFLFHQIVGPIHVFERIIKMIGTGDLTASVRLRDRDELKDMGADIQQTVAALREAVTADREKLRAADEALAKGDTAGAKKALSTITQWFKI